MSVMKKIRAQQKGKKGSPEYMIGEQLVEICEREPRSAEIIDKDLDVKEMNLTAAAKVLKKYADENRESSYFCITPDVAEKLLRKFYGLPEREECGIAETAVEQKEESAFVDLDAFF